VTISLRVLPRILALGCLLGTLCVPSSPASADGITIIVPGFPLFRQQHNLTCEASTASMGTRGMVSEAQLMAVIPRNPNPYLGFRGNPDGQQGPQLVDYGVYAPPLQQALLRYGYQSNLMLYATDADIRTSIDRGWPVEVWIPYGLQSAQPRLAEAGGVQFFLVPHEHAVLVVGYGNGRLYANDPWTRTQVRYLWKHFNRAWGYFGNMALAIQPCVSPGQVTGLVVTDESAAGITWSWTPGIRTVRYQVDVVLHGKRDRSVYSANQSATQATVSNPKANRVYEIQVRSISQCGSVSAPVSMAAEITVETITVTPTPTEGTVTVTFTPVVAPPRTPSPTTTPTP
jgi:uncharacterized protein YvpB